MACHGLGDCAWRGGKCTAVVTDDVFGVRLRYVRVSKNGAVLYRVSFWDQVCL